MYSSHMCTDAFIFRCPPNETIHTHTQKTQIGLHQNVKLGLAMLALKPPNFCVAKRFERFSAPLLRFFGGNLGLSPPCRRGVPPQKLAACFPTEIMDPQALGPRALELEETSGRTPKQTNGGGRCCAIQPCPLKGGTNRSLFERLVFKDDST